MNNNKLKIIFLDCLSEKFKLEGFKYSKAKSAFVRKVDFGEQWYTLTFLKYSGQEGFEINPGHHLRYEEVESFYHKTSSFSKNDQKGTTTIGCSLENYLANGKDMFRRSIKSEGDAIIACNYYCDLYKDKMNPFFKTFNTLERLHKLINDNPDKELNIINPIFRGIKGLIIAHLLNIEGEIINELIKTYSKQYEVFYKGFYKSDFDKVVENILIKRE